MTRTYYILLGLCLSLLLSSACTSFTDQFRRGQDLPGKDTTVRMGQATWDTGWFQAQVYRLLLEELGYTVKSPETLENVAFHIFSAQGDVDFWANGWFPLHERYFMYDRVAGRIIPVGYQVRKGGLQGYLIDKTSAETFGISDVSDLRDPGIASHFDWDNNGKADLIGCNKGWGCEGVIEHHLDAYNLRETVEHIQGDYSTLMAEAIDRYESGKPILFYSWTPNWTVSELVVGQDVIWLSVPFSSLPDDPDAETEVDSLPGCLETPCNTGFGVNDIRVVANVEFLRANPAAAKLFEMVEIPLEDIAAQNMHLYKGENSDEDIRRHAEQWIEDNRDRVNQWLDSARAAGRQ